MILRRVTEHVKAQNWTAVALDFVIVVVGVFIGLQVQDWASARAQAEQHQRYHDRLYSDFLAIEKRIGEHLVVFENVLDGADTILERVRAPDKTIRLSDIDKSRFETALSVVTDQRIPPGQSATYVEMVSAGQLSGLRNAELRNKLAEYDRLSEIHLEVFRTTARLNDSQAPIYYRHFKVKAVNEPGALSGITNKVVSYDLDGMRIDPEFETAIMILQQSMQNNLGVRLKEKQLVGEILALLKEETQL